jgi:hypothetical protein
MAGLRLATTRFKLNASATMRAPASAAASLRASSAWRSQISKLLAVLSNQPGQILRQRQALGGDPRGIKQDCRGSRSLKDDSQTHVPAAVYGSRFIENGHKHDWYY